MRQTRLTYAQRNGLIASSVILLHVLALWALQTGLLRRAVEVLIPAEIISQVMDSATPKPVAPMPVRLRPVLEKPLQPEPLPPETAPSPNAPVVSSEPVVAADAVATAAANPVAPPAKVELPSSDAQYLQNPKPAYPAISKRFGEQGKVVVRVLIGADGLAQQAEIRQSSGFERLDKAALATVLSWRYVPGKRGGVPQSMWFEVPINFKLE
jgi:protein TonB